MGLAGPSAGCVLSIHKALVMLDICVLEKRGAESAPGSRYLVTNTVIQYCPGDLPLCSAIWAYRSRSTSHLHHNLHHRVSKLRKGFISAYHNFLSPLSYLSLMDLTDKKFMKMFNNCKSLFVAKWRHAYGLLATVNARICKQTRLVLMAQEASCTVFMYSL